MRCPLLALSGHALLHRTCLLLTQSGHWPLPVRWLKSVRWVVLSLGGGNEAARFLQVSCRISSRVAVCGARPAAGHWISRCYIRRSIAGQVSAFRRGLNETGFVEGRNVTIEYRWAEGQYQRLPALAAELVARSVSLIVLSHHQLRLQPRRLRQTYPIVFVVGFDPVGAGLVTDLSKPGGNATGMTLLSYALGQKRLEMVRDLSPRHP